MTWNLNVNKHPDGTLWGRPYITDQGQYVCELFKSNWTEYGAIVEAASEMLAVLEKCEAIVHDKAGSGQCGAGLSELARCELASQISPIIAKARRRLDWPSESGQQINQQGGAP